jgi:hypothetical protein
MRYLKTLGLAAVAAMALAAFVGAGTASATELCSTNTSPCTGTMYPAGTKIESKLKAGTKAVLTNPITNVTCTGSGVGGATSTTGSSTETVKGSITAFSFTGCSDTFGDTCTVTTLNLPYNAEIHTTEEKANGNGKLTVRSSGKGNPGATVVCGAFINCTFTTALATLHVDGGNPALATALGIPLLRTGGLCPKEANWDAEYEVTTPKPLFVI